MPDHVGRGEVVHEEFVLAFFDAGAELVGDACGAHFRVLVVGGYFWRGDHVSVFAWKFFLDAAVEEEGYVGVFLGFGNMALFDGFGAKVLREDVAHVLGSEGDGEGVVGFVLGHCRYADVLWVGEVGLRGAVDVAEELGYFADAVGAVIEEEEGVVVLDSGLFAAYDNGFDEFVVFVFGVFLLNRCHGIGGGSDVWPFARYYSLHTYFHPIPPLVSVHNVIAPNNRSDLAHS